MKVIGGNTIVRSRLKNVIRFDRTLSQAEVQTLYSANGVYGHEMLPSPGVNKTYEVVSDPILIFDATGGAFSEDGLGKSGTLDLYYHDENTQVGQVNLNSGVIFPRKYVQNMAKNNEAICGIDQQLMLWSSVEQVLYEGTIRIIFDYKVLSV